LSFHPQNTSLLAVGMANGVVALYDLSKISDGTSRQPSGEKRDEGPLVCRSEISEFFHIDRVTSLEWVQYKLNKGVETLLVSGSLDGKILIWDALGNKLRYPKRGLIITGKSGSSGKSSHFSRRNKTELVNCVRQKRSKKNGFVIGGNTGQVWRIEAPPVIQDGIHRAILSNPGSKIVWSQDAVNFMSNIGAGGEVIGLKTKVERSLQEGQPFGKSVMTEIDIDKVINSKIEVSQIYQSPLSAAFDGHFKSCKGIYFHNTNE
jgi:hypothetical protein